MNRRHAAAMLAGLIASQAAPYRLRAQDEPASVELVNATEDRDAVWMNGNPVAVFEVYRGGILVNAADPDYAALIVENPIKTFTAMANKSKRDAEE
jgi:hypothetical protein